MIIQRPLLTLAAFATCYGTVAPVHAGFAPAFDAIAPKVISAGIGLSRCPVSKIVEGTLWQS